MDEAEPGSVLEVRAGTYPAEDLTIDKPIALRGPQRCEAVVTLLRSHTVRSATDAMLRRLTLRCLMKAHGDDPHPDATHVSAGRPRLTRCEASGGNGIYVFGLGKGTFEDCATGGNKFSGILVETGGDPRVRDCAFSGGGQSGIFVFGKSRGTFEGCTIEGHELAGIEVATGGEPAVRDCEFSGGSRAASTFARPVGRRSRAAPSGAVGSLGCSSRTAGSRRCAAAR